jgi:hypothetical protein
MRLFVSLASVVVELLALWLQNISGTQAATRLQKLAADLSKFSGFDRGRFCQQFRAVTILRQPGVNVIKLLCSGKISSDVCHGEHFSLV